MSARQNSPHPVGDAKAPGPGSARAAVPTLSPHGSLATLMVDLDRRRLDAERMQATAPVSVVLGTVLAELRTLPRADSSAAAVSPNDDAGLGLLTPQQAADRLGVSVRWLYRHAKSLPFVRRLSRRALRFDPAGLRRWVTSRS